MKKIIVLSIVMFAFAFQISLTQTKLERNFQELTNEILTNLQSYYAVNATYRGVHDYDYKFTDYSSGGIKKEIKRLKNFEVRLHKYTKSKLSDSLKFNLKLLKSNVDIALHDLASQKTYRSDPYLYVGEAVNGVYYIVVSEYAPMETRIHNIIARMKVVPDLFYQAKKNLKTPPPSIVKLAREFIETGIEFYKSVETEMSERFPELAQDIHISATGAINAFKDYDSFLETVPKGEAGSFAIGKDAFEYKLKNQYFISISADSLAKLGEYYLEEYQAEYDDYMAKLEADGSNVDSVFMIDCLTKDDILDYYQWETEQARLFIETNDLMTVPDDIGDCIVVETPNFLTNMISSIAYHPPGTFNPDQTGYFYVRPIPDEMEQKYKESKYQYIHRRGFKGAVVHEAFPGHHYQFQMAAKVADPVRKWQENACFYEGWALYCEQMMFEQRFYGDDERIYPKILRGIIFRAARIIADVKLQTKEWSRDDATLWMADLFDADTSWVSTEINWYSMAPGVPMSYLAGKLEIMKLLEAYKLSEGDKFSLKGFHDKLHQNGSIPPSLLWEVWGLKRD